MQPIIIKARLLNGFVASDPWSPAIDGILAYEHVRLTLGPDALVEQANRRADIALVTGLPFQVVTHGKTWWYACSSPQYKAIAKQRLAVHRRFDDHEADRLDPAVKSVKTDAGPYKAARFFDTRILTRHVIWHAIGDIDGVMRLLSNVTAIGKARQRGNGNVVDWEVTEGAAGTENTALYDRPLPVGYAETLGLVGETMPWGVTPPARASVTECVMPERV